MARAHRYYIPGHIWHLTHRCHKKEFLLKFSKDRKRWLELLFEAKKRYGLIVLNYMVTSNHVHLIVFDDSGKDVIPRSVQLIAGRTGQEYNRRKQRKGAFWEDRYHATAVENNQHLIQCMIYIDLNMVRAGAVDHPSDWPWSGYNEIQKPKKRYSIIDYNHLMLQLNYKNYSDLTKAYRKWIEVTLKEKVGTRDSRWSQSIATGSRQFVEKIKRELGSIARGRQVADTSGEYHELKETQALYGNGTHWSEQGNTVNWNVLPETLV